MKYVKLTARPDSWFLEGTEVYDYNCEHDNKYRISLKEYLEATKDGMIFVRGFRVCESPTSEGKLQNELYFDGESCAIDEFDMEIVDSAQ